MGTEATVGCGLGEAVGMGDGTGVLVGTAVGVGVLVGTAVGVEGAMVAVGAGGATSWALTRGAEVAQDPATSARSATTIERAPGTHTE